jgi:uncharacterized protein DUF4190
MPTDEFDDDDRPRRPRSSRDEDEDRPARRRRDDADDYDDPVRRPGGGAPHRGVVVLVLGILGLCCGICGLIAFILGLVDIGKMNKGEMDPSGKGMTMAGLIIGIIGFVLNCSGGIYLRTHPGVLG